MFSSLSNPSISPSPDFSSFPASIVRAFLPASQVTNPPSFSNLFRIRTYEKLTHNPFRICTYKTQDLKPFRMNTYKKTGGEG
jgi:hypothetical protein